MDTVQLTYSLRKDKYTQAAFQGVYPLNKLTNRIVSYPALIIANVDTSEKPGSHWVAFISHKIVRRSFSTLMDYLRAIILELLLLF